MVGIEVFNSKTDIVERLESEGDLHNGSIQRQGFDGVALDEKAVANVLEITNHFCLFGAPQERQRSGKTDILGIVTSQTPLSEQVASLTSFLTRGQ
jgi:hypothetical protein